MTREFLIVQACVNRILMLPEKTNDTAPISEVTTRVDIDFRNAFIAMSHLMSQAELWRTIIEFHIPGEQIYGSATVRLARNDSGKTTIPFKQVQHKEALRSRICSISLSMLCCGCSRRLGRTRVSAMVCRLARTRMTAVKTPTTAISLIT